MRLHSYNEKEVNFSKIDGHAKQASHEDTRSFDDLVTYLNRILQNGFTKNAKLMLARGLMTWMGHAQTILDVNAPYNTPMNLVVEMVNSRVPHAHAFKIFCGYAGIDCRIVVGRAKGNPYRAGDGDSYFLQNQMWNIIITDGLPHIVHPRWCVEVTVGASRAGEIILESDGQTKLRQKTDEEGRRYFIFDEFWFCTHPKIFVTRCFPNIPQDQLLSGRERIKTVNEFLALPDLRQEFFNSDLTLLTNMACRLKSNKGKCQIIIRSNRSKGLNFSYEMSIIGQINSSINEEDLPRLVLFSRNKNDYEFDIQFPVIGEYRFVVRLHTDNKIENCCEFRIKCTEAYRNCRRVPFENGLEGYGFSPSAEASGLRKPSDSGGRVYIEPSTSTKENSHRNKILKFQIEEEFVDNTVYSSELTSVDENGKIVSHEGKSHVIVNPTTCLMSVELSMDQPGEYGLVINASKTLDGNQSVTPAVKYIVTTDKELHDNQLKIKRKKREIVKGNKLAAKQEEKQAEQKKLSLLQTEIKQLERRVKNECKKGNNSNRKNDEKRTVPEELDCLQTEADEPEFEVGGRKK